MWLQQGTIELMFISWFTFDGLNRKMRSVEVGESEPLRLGFGRRLVLRLPL